MKILTDKTNMPKKGAFHYGFHVQLLAGIKPALEELPTYYIPIKWGSLSS